MYHELLVSPYKWVKPIHPFLPLAEFNDISNPYRTNKKSFLGLSMLIDQQLFPMLYGTDQKSV